MSASPSVEGQSHWKEYKNAEGRVYWSHALTKQSVWEKPDELKTPFERAITKTNWKQYTSKGKPYYVNSVTKETVWNLPPELVQLKEKVEAEEQAKRERAQRKASGRGSPTPSDDSRAGTPRSDYDDDMALVRRRSRSPTPEPAPRIETITIPPGGFTTHEKAEEAFIHLLKREGIDETFTWDTTMRRIVQDPLWKALDSLAKKKAAFEKWQHQIVAEKRAAREARITELKPHITRLFANSGIIKSYSTMKTADKAFAKDKHWRRAKPDERRELLEAYTSELRNREEAARRSLKESNIQTLTKLIRSLDITVTTRWRDGQRVITQSEAFRTDPKLQKMETLDILNVFDEYARQLEKEHEEEAHRKRVEYRRRARKARDAFKALLRELREKGDLTRTSKWKDTLPKFRSDERYTTLLGLPGSSPLDLWMDAVDDLQLEAEERTAKIESQLRGSAIKLETTLEEFEKLCDAASVREDAAARKEAFDVIHARLARAAAEAARIEEKKRRDRIDDLRYALRKVRQIESETTYEAALPHMQDLAEFKEIASDEDRHAAFEKHIRRLKDKEAETSESGRRGDKDRERDRYKMDVDDDYRRRSDRDREREREYSRRDRDRDYRDDYRDRDDHRDRDRDRDYRRDRDRERDRDRGDRRDKDRDHRDRSDRDRERDRESRDHGRDRERERDRDKGADRRRDRDRDRETDERDTKRRRVTPLPGASEKEGEREEGEI